MVMDKNKRTSGNYTYGNVAYEIQPKVQPEVRPVRKTKVGKSKKAQRALKVKLKLMWTVAVLGAITFVILNRAAKINSLTANVRSLKSDIATIQKDNANLEVQIASACNLKSIEDTALNSFKMVMPGNNSIKYIEVGSLAQVEENTAEVVKAGFDIKKLLGFND